MPDPFLQNAPKERDQRALTALFSTVVLLTKQLEYIAYDSYSHTRKQLYALGKVGYLERIAPEFRTSEGKLWMLSRREFFRELKGSKLYRDESYPDLPSRLEHMVATNDIYAGTRNELEHRFGEEDVGWKWKHEARAYDQFDVGSGAFVHRPDAELSFGERVFYIERQTHKAKQPPSEFHKRMRRYAARERYLARESITPEVLWACDGERDVRYASTAAERHGVRAVCGSPEEIIKHVVESVAEEAKRLGMEPFELNTKQASKRAQYLLGGLLKEPSTNGTKPHNRASEEETYRLDF